MKRYSSQRRTLKAWRNVCGKRVVSISAASRQRGDKRKSQSSKNERLGNLLGNRRGLRVIEVQIRGRWGPDCEAKGAGRRICRKGRPVQHRTKIDKRERNLVKTLMGKKEQPIVGGEYFGVRT